MITFTKRVCRRCHSRKTIDEFGGRQRGACDQCRETRRQRFKREVLDAYQVVEVIGSRMFHLAQKGGHQTYCKTRNVVPLRYGNGPAMLLDLSRDAACCSKCRAKLSKVFEAIGE